MSALMKYTCEQKGHLREIYSMAGNMTHNNVFIGYYHNLSTQTTAVNDITICEGLDCSATYICT